MGGKMQSLSILRSLYRELRPSVNAPQKHVYETQVWKYIVNLCRDCKSLPPANIAEARRNLEQTGRSYVFYLQGTKEYHRISDEYKGAGERSADETAKLLGFKMPNEPKEPKGKKSSSSSKGLENVESSSNNESMKSTSASGFNSATV